MYIKAIQEIGQTKGNRLYIRGKWNIIIERKKVATTTRSSVKREYIEHTGTTQCHEFHKNANTKHCFSFLSTRLCFRFIH